HVDAVGLRFVVGAAHRVLGCVPEDLSIALVELLSGVTPEDATDAMRTTTHRINIVTDFAETRTPLTLFGVLLVKPFCAFFRIHALEMRIIHAPVPMRMQTRVCEQEAMSLRC